MGAFQSIARWWSRHRTGEKTGAVLAFLAIVVGLYFGLHTMRQEGGAPSHSQSAGDAAAVQPAVSMSPCPSGNGTLRSDALAISCDILSYCTAREAAAPASSDATYQQFEEQSGREAVRRYYSELVAVVGRLNAHGLHSAQTDVTAMDQSDQDCDSMSSAASGVAQLANRIRDP